MLALLEDTSEGDEQTVRLIVQICIDKLGNFLKQDNQADLKIKDEAAAQKETAPPSLKCILQPAGAPSTNIS